MDETSDIVDFGSPSAASLAAEPIAPPPSLAEHDTHALDVSDDLPCKLAIGGPELDAIERYMADILDEILAQSPRATKDTHEE